MANSKSKTRKKVIVFSLIGMVIGGLLAFTIVRKREVAINVQTENATRRNLTELVVANGKIQPVVQVVINPEVSGEIIALPVKEGQLVQKGDLLLKIKPDNYIASRNSAAASYHSALASQNLAQANLDKAALEFARNKSLFADKLISDSQFLEAKTTLAVMQASYETSVHQVDQAKAALARSEDDLSKTTIVSPINGTVTKLRSQLGERVVGTAMMAGTEVMTVANLEDMEARVDIGEIDVVLMALDQNARIEVDAFHDQKFTGKVTEIANASKTPAAGSGSSGGMSGGGSSSQEATKFEVKIRINEKEIFRPGMSVTAEIETRYRTNVLTVPIQSVTTRLPKEKSTAKNSSAKTRSGDSADPDPPPNPGTGKKSADAPKAVEVLFVKQSERVKMMPVKRGISDDAYVEIIEGVAEGDEVISGGYKAISRELEDGKKVKITKPKTETEKEKG